MKHHHTFRVTAAAALTAHHLPQHCRCKATVRRTWRQLHALKTVTHRSCAAGEGETPLEWNRGSNGYVYFVATSAGGPLTQLPHTTPAQIKAARHLKKLLTGRLTSQVSSYPVFPGTEANYLRAQVRA